MVKVWDNVWKKDEYSIAKVRKNKAKKKVSVFKQMRKFLRIFYEAKRHYVS